MANPLNNGCLTGYLTADPIFLKNHDNVEFAMVSTLKVQRNYKNKDGIRESDFIPIRYEGTKRMVFAHMLHEQDLISVTGSYTSKSYEKDGGTVYTLYFLVENIQFTPRNRAGEENNENKVGYVEQEELPI